MKSVEIEKLVEKTFFSMLKKVKKDSGVITILSPKEKGMIKDFVSQIGDVDKKFILDFLTFQFSVYAEKDTQLGKGNIQLSWVIGKKAIERWENKKDGAYHVIKEKRKSLAPDREISTGTIQMSEKFLDELRAGSARSGMPYFLIACIQRNLYKEDNQWCKICNLKEDCTDPDMIEFVNENL